MVSEPWRLLLIKPLALGDISFGSEAMPTIIGRAASSRPCIRPCRNHREAVLEATSAIGRYFAATLWRAHIARASAEALPYALKEWNLLGDRQTAERDIYSHGSLLPQDASVPRQPCNYPARTMAINGSRPWAFHQDRFYRESAASVGSPQSGPPTRQVFAHTGRGHRSNTRRKCHSRGSPELGSLRQREPTRLPRTS